MVIALGNASVNNSGISTKTPMMTAWMTKEMLVVRPRFVFSFPPDSNRLSSNIVCLPAEHYEILRHQPPPACSQLWGEFRLSKTSSYKPYRANLLPKPAL